MSEQKRPEFAIDFDPQQIRERYDVELGRRSAKNVATRAKDRSANRGEPGPVGADHWTAPIERAPIDVDIELLVIGGGFAGLLTAARAREAGVESLKIVEAAGDFGGVWYWNRYPNAQCDTESYVYLPLLEETGYMPTRKFTYAKEIFEHAQRIGRQFGLYEDALFQTEVRTLEWSEDDARWTARTDRGDVITARYVMYSRGAFGLPKYPDVPGLDSFPGEVFHASRWNYDYTGGAPGVKPTKLADKRVAVIGTAATGVQIVSGIADVTGELYVVQRTPAAFFGDRSTYETEPEWYASLPRGWQAERRGNFDGSTSGVIPEEDLVNDTWTQTFRASFTAERVLVNDRISELSPEDAMQALQLADMEIMERARAYTRTQVTDAELAAKLEPWYGLRCKRATFDDGYLASFNRPNVHLIDAPASGLERIEGSTLIAGGERFDVDCIVLATGYDTTQDQASRVGIDVIGRNGERLSDHNRNGLRSLHGVMTDGFPNLFATGQGQDPFAVNYTSVLAVQTDHLVRLITAAREAGAQTIEPSKDAVEAWAQTIEEVSGPFRAYQQHCVPSYFNGDGDTSKVGALAATAFTPGVVVFTDLIRNWRDTGYSGLLFDGQPFSERAVVGAR